MKMSVYRFSELFTYQSGKAITPEGGNVPVYGSNGIVGFTNRSKYSNKIIIGRVGANCGSVLYCDRDFNATDNTLITTCDETKILYKFAFYLLKQYGLNKFSGGSAQPLLTQGYLNPLKCELPEIEKQRNIINILSRYDETIVNNNKRIKLLEQMAQNLYKEWFVRFRFPGWQNAEFENGIPKGWKVEKLGNLFEITSSKRVYENEYVESGIPFYRSKEIIELSNNQNVSLELYISDELYNRYKNAYGVPKESDILITSVGSIGNIYQVQKNDKFYFKDGNLTWIKSSKNKILSNYLVCWLQSDIGKSTLLSSTIGTSQSALTIENLKRIKILLPNESSLLKFSNIFSSINKEIINLTISKQNLAKQRDLLLPRLMSGKVEVK